jgi:hypothetical protein
MELPGSTNVTRRTYCRADTRLKSWPYPRRFVRIRTPSRSGGLLDSTSACLERAVKTPPCSFRECKRCHPATGPKDIRRGGRNLGTRFDEVFPESERGDQKSVFIRTPLSGHHHQGRMQKRLSARSSCFVESVGSGGGSDSELIQCADKGVSPDFRLTQSLSLHRKKTVKSNLGKRRLPIVQMSAERETDRG